MGADELLVMVVVAMCPGSLFIGIVGTLLGLRAIGVIGSPRRRVKRRVIRLRRIPEEDVEVTIADWVAGGWEFLGLREVATGVFTLWFQEEVGW